MCEIQLNAQNLLKKNQILQEQLDELRLENQRLEVLMNAFSKELTHYYKTPPADINELSS